MTSGVFDDLSPDQISQAEKLLQDAIKNDLPELCDRITSGEKLNDDEVNEISQTIKKAVSELVDEELSNKKDA